MLILMEYTIPLTAELTNCPVACGFMSCSLILPSCTTILTDFPHLINIQCALSSLFIPLYCLVVACWPRHACSLAHTYTIGQLADQMNRQVLSLHGIISTWPHMQTCGCLFHPDLRGFTTSAAHACWGYCIAHVRSRCSPTLEQCFVNPVHGKSQRTSSTQIETSPREYQLFMQVLVE